eukprot:14078349-Heterocapsa_arctica.AAC.1
MSGRMRGHQAVAKRLPNGCHVPGKDTLMAEQAPQNVDRLELQKWTTFCYLNTRSGKPFTRLLAWHEGEGELWG